MIGVTTDPIPHELSWRDVVKVGFGMARVVLRPGEDLSEFLSSCAFQNVKCMGVYVHGQSNFPDISDAESAARYESRYYRYGGGSYFDYIQIGNEMDGQEGGSSSPMTPEAYNWLVGEVAPVFRESATIVAGGLVSGDPSWVDSMDLSLIDLVSVHPYGRWPSENGRWGPLLPDWSGPVYDSLLYRYERQLAGRRPLCVTEYGGKVEELGEEWRRYVTEFTVSMKLLMSEGILAFASVYGLSNKMVDGMGCLDHDGNLTDMGRGVRSVLS